MKRINHFASTAALNTKLKNTFHLPTINHSRPEQTAFGWEKFNAQMACSADSSEKIHCRVARPQIEIAHWKGEQWWNVEGLREPCAMCKCNEQTKLWICLASLNWYWNDSPLYSTASLIHSWKIKSRKSDKDVAFPPFVRISFTVPEQDDKIESYCCQP